MVLPLVLADQPACEASPSPCLERGSPRLTGDRAAGRASRRSLDDGQRSKAGVAPSGRSTSNAVEDEPDQPVVAGQHDHLDQPLAPERRVGAGVQVVRDLVLAVERADGVDDERLALGQAVGRLLVAQRLDRLGRDADLAGDRLVGVPLVDGLDLAAGRQDGQLAVGAGQDAVVPKLAAQRGGLRGEGRVVHDAGGRPADVATAVDQAVPERLALGIELRRASRLEGVPSCSLLGAGVHGVSGSVEGVGTRLRCRSVPAPIDCDDPLTSDSR